MKISQRNNKEIQMEALCPDVEIHKDFQTYPRRLWNIQRILNILTFIIVFILLLLMIVVLALTCYFNRLILAKTSDQLCLSLSCLQAAVDINKSINVSADPCVDFNQFVCGKWNDDQIIPKGDSLYSTIKVVNSKILKIQKKLLENQNLKDQSLSLAKAIRLYNSCINIEKINELGKTPLMNQLNQIYGKYGGWDMLSEHKTFPTWNLQKMVEDLNVKAPIFELYVQEKNSQINIFYLQLTDLMLDSQFLVDTSKPENIKVVDAFKIYMQDIGKLLGVKKSKSEIFNDIVDLETKIAIKHPKEENKRDPDYMNSDITLSKLQIEICPMFNWTEILRENLKWMNITFKNDFQIIILFEENLKEICKLFESYTNDPQKKLILHNYIVWKFVQSKINYLSEDFLQVQDTFNTIRTGSIGRNERWVHCVNVVQNNMGLVLGNIYITQHFNKNYIPQILEMVNLLTIKFRKNLQNTKWLDSKTLKEAVKKIDALRSTIGYSKSILDRTYIEEHFNKIEINNETYYENFYRIIEEKRKRNLRKINYPSDNINIENPQEVNAFYFLNTNKIVIPAGILQHPFFELEFPRSLKYGGLGMIIGHEITHGFDNRGSKYDFSGNLRSWWTEKTKSLFKKKSECFIRQYSKYSFDGQSINGENTLGDNIADNGGVRLAYQIYKDLEKKFGEDKPLPGLKYTNDQLFFIAFARLWCSIQTKQSVMINIFSGSHTAHMFRANGALSNIEEFAEAFNCPVGSPMNPEKKCLLW